MSRYYNSPCKVYVGNLDLTVSKYDLENMFGRYGPVRDIWVARNPPGFAFVEFDDPRDAQDAVRALDGIRLCGRRLRVEMSTGGRRRIEIRRRSRSRSVSYSSRRRSRSRSSSSRSRSRSSSRGRR